MWTNKQNTSLLVVVIIIIQFWVMDGNEGPLKFMSNRGGEGERTFVWNLYLSSLSPVSLCSPGEQC